MSLLTLLSCVCWSFLCYNKRDKHYKFRLVFVLMSHDVDWSAEVRNITVYISVQKRMANIVTLQTLYKTC